MLMLLCTKINCELIAFTICVYSSQSQIYIYIVWYISYDIIN